MNSIQKLKLEAQIGYGFRIWFGITAFLHDRSKPFHADAKLLNFIDSNIKSVNSFVESGTFTGVSTEYIAKNYPNVDVRSCDINRIFLMKARRKLNRYDNVTLYNGDSSKVIERLLPVLNPPIMFWLDAHWLRSLPLQKELRLIYKSGKKSIIMIDDFESDMVYDNKIITEDLILSVLPEDTKVEYIKAISSVAVIHLN